MSSPQTSLTESFYEKMLFFIEPHVSQYIQVPRSNKYIDQITQQVWGKAAV